MARSRRRFTASLLTASMRSAAQELGTTWPSLRKAFQRHGLGMPARNPEAIRQRAIAPAHKRTGQAATPPLDPVFLALNPGALPARERSPAASSTSGSAATSSTPPWGPTWWWGCTAKATRVDQPPGPGRSSAAPTAPTGWPANAPAAPNAAVPIARPGPSNPRSGRWRPMPANLRRTVPPDIEQRFHPRRRWVVSHLSAVPGGSIWFRLQGYLPGLRLSPAGSCPGLFLPVSASLVSKP